MIVRVGIHLDAAAHRFRDTFAVRLLQGGSTLYDVAKLLGTSNSVAEKHYTPWVKELQERAGRAGVLTGGACARTMPHAETSKTIRRSILMK